MSLEAVITPQQHIKIDDYLMTRYPLSTPETWLDLPLGDEAFVSTWRQYVQETTTRSAWDVLKERLLPLCFPIRKGMSHDALYLAATRRGFFLFNENESLILEKPDDFKLMIYQSVAGRIPIISTNHRRDFVKLVQALTKRNEPAPIPDSMGACMVAGYNNWGRIRAYQEQWMAKNPENCSEIAWQGAFKELIPQKHLYQDCFIILHDGPYSGIPARDMNLNGDKWHALSLKIRLDHECAHYFTRRIFGVMRRHVFDELLADYAGIVAALGYYRSDWFLQFMGLEAYPAYRAGGRLQNYLEGIPMQSYAFHLVQTQLKMAAENLERFDKRLKKRYRQLAGKALVLLAIAHFTLTELATESAPDLLLSTLQTLQEQMKAQEINRSRRII